ncbi:sodium:solute symporter family protein [candidate division KSB1 bacterium]|nr:sodium:solute symporter family protein [candidate division KSB1 bacterium]
MSRIPRIILLIHFLCRVKKDPLGNMIDFVIIFFYFFLMLWVGWKHRNQSADAYWITNRQYSAGFISMSLVMTIFGASSVMGVIGLGYTRGLTGVWWSLTGGLALIPFSVFLAGRVRNFGVITLPDILKKAYGQRVSIPAAVVIVIAWCGVIAAQLVAAGLLVKDVFQIHFIIALFFVTVIFTLYTLWGGQQSVVRTDFLQLLFFSGGLLLSLVFMLRFIHINNVSNPLPADMWLFPVSASTRWYDVLVFYPLIVGMPYLVGPDIYSRVLCAKDSRSAFKASLAAAFIVIFLAFFLASWGMLARFIMPGVAAESALPRILNKLMPAGIRGIVMTGFLGALMSSADTCLMSASTIFSLNVLGAFPRFPQKYHLITTKITVILVGLVACVIAGTLKGIISSLLLGYTVFVAGVAMPTLGVFLKSRCRIEPVAAFWAVVLGGSVAVLGKFQDGRLLINILSPSGAKVLQTCFGKEYLSILPVFLSLLALAGISFVINMYRRSTS